MTVSQPGNISPHLSTFAMLHLPVRPAFAAKPLRRDRSCHRSPHARSNASAIVPRLRSGQARAAWSNAELARARGCSLGVLEYPSAAGFRHVDDAVAIHRHALAAAAARKVRRLRIGHEVPHLAVAFAADADAALHCRIGVRHAGLRVGAIEHPRAIEEDAARPPELPPLGEELPLLVEHLDARVAAIGHEQPSLRIEHEAVRRVELALTRSLPAPLLDVLPVAVELDDARVAVAAVAV